MDKVNLQVGTTFRHNSLKCMWYKILAMNKNRITVSCHNNFDKFTEIWDLNNTKLEFELGVYKLIK